MTKKKSRAKSTGHKIWLRPAVHAARRKLPGQVRQRIRRAIDGLQHSPRPVRSKELRLPDRASYAVQTDWEIRRIRLEDWRIVYAINETWAEIAVLAIHKRPPYGYEDLDVLLSDLN